VVLSHSLVLCSFPFPSFVSTHSLSFFFLLLLPPPSSTLFPYTTLFRSVAVAGDPFAQLDLHHRTRSTGTIAVIGIAVVCLIVKRSEEHTSELQSPDHLVCRLLLEKKNKKNNKSRNFRQDYLCLV